MESASWSRKLCLAERKVMIPLDIVWKDTKYRFIICFLNSRRTTLTREGNISIKKIIEYC